MENSSNEQQPHVLYEIAHTVTGKRFVYLKPLNGIEKTLWGNRQYLNKNGHGCKELQSDWNQFGESSFTFKVLPGTYSNKDEAEAALRAFFLQEARNGWHLYNSKTVLPEAETRKAEPEPSAEAAPELTIQPQTQSVLEVLMLLRQELSEVRMELSGVRAELREIREEQQKKTSGKLSDRINNVLSFG